MKYKVKTKDCHLIVRAKASSQEVFDLRTLDIFFHTHLRGFLHPTIIKPNVVEYTGPIGISLSERMKNPICKREFLSIIEQFVVALQKIRSNHLILSNLLLDIQHIYINEITKELQFVYLPLAVCNANMNAFTCMESIMYSANPQPEYDMQYVSRFIYFFMAQQKFDIDAIERYIENEDRSVTNSIKKQNAGQSGFMTNKKQDYYEHYERKETPGSDATALLMEEEDLSEETGLLNDEATGLMFGDETTVLYQEEVESIPVRYPTISRTSTQESVTINKPVFRIGKEKSYVDYFVMNNNAVSRSHADIITRGTQFYIIDLNSKNHTFINGQQIPPQLEVELRDGDNVRLANEEFVFHT